MPGPALLEVLETAREKGFLGPGPVDRQLAHGRDLAKAIGAFEGSFLDLGSGGGLPGLVLADTWPQARGVLLDAQARRCGFLSDAIERLGWGARLAVACGRAEVLAREAALRGGFGLVVARAFGAPAVTAECAVGFLHAGARLVVTEPPTDGGEERWPEDGLTLLGLRLAGRIRHREAGAVVLELVDPVDERWPRRDGVPTKRPLWD